MNERQPDAGHAINVYFVCNFPKNYTTTSQVEGNNMTSVITILDGKGFRSEADFNGQKIIECVTDEDNSC